MAVRYEKVVLDLEDRFSRGALTAAGSAKVLDKALDGTGSSSRSMSRDVDSASASIDKLSGRLGLAARAVGALGPALAPISTAALPVITGLTASLGATALGAGAVVLAFQGLGDVMKAVSKAQLEPTTENIEKARAALAQLPPAARKAVREMQDFREVLGGIQIASAQGFLPGFVEGLGQLETLAPRVQTIMRSVGQAAGDLFVGAADGLAGPKGREFLEFIQREAAPALTTFGQTLGNVAKGLGSLMMAMDPLSDDFSAGLLKASDSFAKWADGLSRTEGFQEFIDYVRSTGPQVVETVESLANALLQIGEAASPLGGPVLRALEGIADAVAKIADSPLGPPIMAAVTAMSALSLATKGFNAVANVSFGRNSTLRTGLASTAQSIGMMTTGVAMTRAESEANKRTATRRGAVAMGVGGAAVLGAGIAANNAGLQMQNTLMLASIGMMAGPWGAAAGAAAGAAMDLASALDDGPSAAIENFQERLQASQGDMDSLVALRADLEKAASGGDGNWLFDALTDSKSELVGPILKQAKQDIKALAAAQLAEARAAGFATRAQFDHAQSLRATAEAAVAASNAALGYEGRLRDMREAVKGVTGVFAKNGQVQHGLTEEQQKAGEKLIAMGEGWANLTAAQRRAAGGSRANRAEFIKTAMQLGMGERAARAYADSLFRVPPKVRTQVEADIAQAMSNVQRIQRMIDALHDKNVTVTVNRANGSDRTTYRNDGSAATHNSRGGLNPTFQASGGPIYGPGTATSDSIPAMLSNGEYVIRAAAVARYGTGFFDRANQMRLASGGHVGSDRDGVHELSRAAREAAKAMREETKARLDAVREQRNSLRTAVRDRFRSDIFAAPDNAWSGGGSDWKSRLQGDIAQARQVTRAEAQLKRKGLDGRALDDLLQNADVSQIRGFASMSKKDLAAYERLYRTRDKASAVAGRNAGEAAYGKQIDRLQVTLRRIERELKDAPAKTGKAVGDSVNGGARNGARRGG